MTALGQQDHELTVTVVQSGQLYKLVQPYSQATSPLPHSTVAQDHDPTEQAPQSAFVCDDPL